MPNIVKIFLVLTAVILGYGLMFVATARAQSLTVACYKDYRPYSYINDNGETVGVLIDFWQLWAEKNQASLKFLPGHLSESLNRIKTGEADLMIGLFKSEERDTFMDFSDALLEIHTNLYVREDLNVSSPADLTAATPVGVIKEDFVVSYLKANYPNIAVTPFAGSKEVIRNAVSGKIRAYALDFPNAVFSLAEHDSLTEFKNLSTLYKETLRAGVTKGNKDLLDRINTGLKSISKADVDALYNKWGILPQPLMLRYKGWIIGIVMILLGGCIGFAYYIWALKARIRRISSGGKPFDRDEWETVIAGGENDWVEFKSSLRWNMKTEKVDKHIEAVIIKSLSAFMNARGGTLFIGINDDGEAVGIETDYNTFQKKPNRDGFMLKLSGMISQHMGRQSHKSIITEIHTFNGRDVCRITVKPGDRPVYIKEQGKESFYIRAGASSVPLSMSEAHEYINSRWPAGR
ncbi:MAG: transporter substrate-binding domain-containing protein [Desulfobacterales bacterium]|nr:transporter substrate-binding domain-containing protein [Desulfobacterales bacterium]